MRDEDLPAACCRGVFCFYHRKAISYDRNNAPGSFLDSKLRFHKTKTHREGKTVTHDVTMLYFILHYGVRNVTIGKNGLCQKNNRIYFLSGSRF